MSRISRLSRLVTRDTKKALLQLRAYDDRYQADVNWRGNRGGFLVDLGGSEKNEALVQEGINSLLPLLPKASPLWRSHLLYNLGNGYNALFSIARGKPGYSFNPDTTPLVEAKRYYREALTFVTEQEPSWCAKLLTNYANCLSSLGRPLEAIQHYDKALTFDPLHPMALGNLCVELERFANISHDHSVLRDALYAVDKALASDGLSEVSVPRARPYFQKVRNRLAMEVAGLADSAREPKDARLPEGSLRFREYLAFCQKHDIMLNFAIKHGRPQSPNRDDVFFSIVTRLDDNKTFPRLARIVNELKENYAGARLLLYEACDHPYSTAAYDNLTHYVYNLDYAVTGVVPAKLKLAFGSAYNILDKIALFIRHYLGIQLEEFRTDFDSVWRTKPGAPPRPEIMRASNMYLYALYDLSRDLQRDGFWGRLRDLRNQITHRYLVPHTESREQWNEECDSPLCHIGYAELASKTIELLRVVRYAVIYLIGFIDTAESRRLAGISGFTPPIRVPPYQHYPVGPLGRMRRRHPGTGKTRRAQR